MRWEASSLCEAIGRLHEELIGDVGSAVVFVFDDMQGGQRELLCEAPDHTERRCNVEPATNEHRRNIGDAVDSPADAIRWQKRVLAEEVSHQASEAEAKRSVGVAGAWLRRSMPGCQSLFPRAPGSRSTVSQVRVMAHPQAVVGRRKNAAPLQAGHQREQFSEC